MVVVEDSRWTERERDLMEAEEGSSCVVMMVEEDMLVRRVVSRYGGMFSCSIISYNVHFPAAGLKRRCKLAIVIHPSSQIAGDEEAYEDSSPLAIVVLTLEEQDTTWSQREVNGVRGDGWNNATQHPAIETDGSTAVIGTKQGITSRNLSRCKQYSTGEAKR